MLEDAREAFCCAELWGQDGARKRGGGNGSKDVGCHVCHSKLLLTKRKKFVKTASKNHLSFHVFKPMTKIFMYYDVKTKSFAHRVEKKFNFYNFLRKCFTKDLATRSSSLVRHGLYPFLFLMSCRVHLIKKILLSGSNGINFIFLPVKIKTCVQ